MIVNAVKHTIFVILSFLLLSACHNDKSVDKRPIVMGDSSCIITENDPKYLQNNIKDISQTNAKAKEKSIAQMMVQVDSVNASKKMEDETFSKAPVMGMTISFENCDIIFDGLKAHTNNNKPIDPKVNSVALFWDQGNFAEMKVRVNGLEDIQVEQRVITKLAVVHEKEIFTLHKLDRFISPWYQLAGKGNIFISTGQNSVQFNQVDHSKIKNALTHALNSKRKKADAVNTWMAAIQRTNSAQDAPCKIQVASSQWRIRGISNGKKVQKLIQFDVPL